MNIPFSPPDMSEKEAKAVYETVLSGWITTGPNTIEFEKQICEYCHTTKTVCLNSVFSVSGKGMRSLFPLTPTRQVAV